jgi:hypothetical protein
LHHKPILIYVNEKNRIKRKKMSGKCEKYAFELEFAKGLR